MARQDTRLESEGAEFLVLGQLLIHRISAYKTYTNMPGYDLVAVNPDSHKSARVQVKSRWRTGALGFPIKNLESDFVVAVFLNRGSKDNKKEILPPRYYVFPIRLIHEAPRSEDWGKVSIKSIPNYESYENRWDLIDSFLLTENA
ncbi:hypothetical protein HYO35_22235 [Vibrio parahaemolyticus]|nr:hypothetical protein [Vibrio parahaemolyticus]